VKFFLLILFVIVVITISFSVAEKDKTAQTTKLIAKENNLVHLKLLHDKFSKIDINAKDLDLDEMIKEIKEARKIYPIDNILLRIDIELEHRRANESYNKGSTKQD
jgi:biopolymer transport protein ExbD